MEIKQSTVNLVVVLAAIIVGAGAWATPVMIAQTGHTISEELDAATDEINTNTDAETEEIGDDIFGGAGDTFNEAGCTLGEMMTAVATGNDLGIFCDEDILNNEFIEGQAGFDDFAKTFEFKPQILELLPSELLPARDCDDDASADEDGDAVNEAGEPLTDALTFTGVTAPDAAADGVFGNETCLQNLSFEDPPKRLKAVTIESGETDTGVVTNLANIRIQIAVVEDSSPALDNNQDCDDVNSANADDKTDDAGHANPTKDFTINVVFDAMVALGPGDKVTIAHDGEVLFPPDGNSNICVRFASDAAGGPFNHKVWLTVLDEQPLNVFNFAPPPAFQNFSFETFSPLDFSVTCGLVLTVKDANTAAALPNIPVTILGPIVAGVDNTVATDANGKASFGVGAQAAANDPDGNQPNDEDMPSGFYVIDVNVPSNPDNAVPTNNNYGFQFADGPVDCTTQVNGNVNRDVNLPPIEPKDLRVRVNNINTGDPIPGATIAITGTDFFGNPIAAPANQVTGADGTTTFDNLDNGAYTITVTAAGFNDGAGFAFIDLFGPPLVETFVGLFPL